MSEQRIDRLFTGLALSTPLARPHHHSAQSTDATITLPCGCSLAIECNHRPKAEDIRSARTVIEDTIRIIEYRAACGCSTKLILIKQDGRWLRIRCGHVYPDG